MLFWSEFVSNKDGRQEDDEFRVWSITKCWTSEHEEATISVSWEPASYGEVSMMPYCCAFVIMHSYLFLALDV
jgi:hypothetical protein